MSVSTADPPITRWRQTLVDRPAIALGGVLVVLYVVTGLVAPGLFSANGIRATLLLACPLAILAARRCAC